MLVTRKIGSFLRGKATPFQVMAAAILGGMLGFIPHPTLAPGSMLALLFLLVVLNANLLVAGVVGGIGLLLSLTIVPVSFEVGRLALDGPTQGLFRSLINAPVTAWFGFEHYAITGGLVIGLIYGALVGAALVAALTSFRRRMLALHSDSEKFKAFVTKGWAKVGAFIFLGGKGGAETYETGLAKKVGLPVRPLGIVLVLLLGVLIYLVISLGSGPIVSSYVQRTLERMNGATVDVGGVEIAPDTGRVTVTGLALCDPDHLEVDRLRAATLIADVSTGELLRRRMSIDLIEVDDARCGEKRARPGALVRTRDVETVTSEESDPWRVKLPDEKQLGDYVQTAKEWNARLKQARQWLETLPKDESSAPEEREGAGAPRPQTLEERLREAVARLGYLGVRAEHLIAQSPTLTIHKVRIGALRTDALKDEVFSVDADHISSHPALLPDSAQVVVRSQSERIRMTVRARPSGDDAALVVRLRDLPVDEFASSITVNGSRVVQGGTMDVLLRGGWAGGIPGHIDLPMRVTLRDSTIRIPEAGEAMVKEFALPIGLRGPLDDLGIAIDDKALADALVKAGADALAGKVQARAQEEIDRATGKVTEKIKEKVGESVGDALGNLLQKPPK